MPSYLRDHRKRLKQRFMEGGPDAMPDYELLELILFRAIPRQDVKPLARRLLDCFGSFNAVLSAPPPKLRNIKGVGESVIVELKVIEAATHRMARSQIMNKPVISSWDALLNYCHTKMSNRETEQFRVLFLDRKNILIEDRAMAEGTVDHVPIYPREIVRNALDLNASALILVHNHPSGDPTPSQDDITMTQTIEQAVDSVGITLHDHLIIGKNHNISFRAERLL
ncbi:MAG: DNA repair protein RadC [Pseudomonadota bacterium]